MSTHMEQMTELKTKICQTLLDTRRSGMPQLIAAMEQCGYFDCPASSRSHMSCKGGLAQHSWYVLEQAQKLNVFFGSPCSTDSVVITALLHDFGKCGQFGKPEYVENILSNGRQCGSRPFKKNKELMAVKHETRGIAELSKYIVLTEDEQNAILRHDGARGTESRGNEAKACDTPLYMIIYFANLWSKKMLEKETGCK